MVGGWFLHCIGVLSFFLAGILKTFQNSQWDPIFRVLTSWFLIRGSDEQCYTTPRQRALMGACHRMVTPPGPWTIIDRNQTTFSPLIGVTRWQSTQNNFLLIASLFWPFLMAPRVDLQCVIMKFPDHTHLLFVWADQSIKLSENVASVPVVGHSQF